MTKKINRDHAQKKHHSSFENDAIIPHLSELLTPSIFAQQSLFRDLGMRNSIPYELRSVNSLLNSLSLLGFRLPDFVF